MTETPKPMPSAIANYRACGHCDAEQPNPVQDPATGLWSREFAHTETCPVRLGTVNGDWDLIRAVVPNLDELLEAGRARREQQAASE